MEKRYEEMGMEMTNRLGFEHKAVILYWTAFEKERWADCETHYKHFKRNF